MVLMDAASKVTIKDIARIAKVSTATVSLVLNNRPGVGKETRYRVLRVARELKYTPNLVARSLVKRQSDAVALMITNTRNPIFPEIAAGVAEVLEDQGYSLNIVSTYDDLEIEAKEIANLRSRGIDGIITSCSLAKDPPLEELVEDGFPLVSVLRRTVTAPKQDYVMVDNVHGGYLAAEHLIRLGHERIAIITGPQNTSTGQERLQGALAAFQAYEVPLRHELIYEGDYFKECGYLATHFYLSLPEERRPTAIYSANDDMAMGAFEALLDAGLDIPEDIALVGFNNVEATSLRTIEMTTIEQHAHEMGRLAAERVIQKIKQLPGSQAPQQVMLEPKLVVRRTCGYGPRQYLRNRIPFSYPSDMEAANV
jgi:LacI family transcriptional regulator